MEAGKMKEKEENQGRDKILKKLKKVLFANFAYMYTLSQG